MTTVTRPSPADVAQLLEDLFGRDVEVTEVTATPTISHTGVVVFDDDAPAYLCSGDIEAVANLGGALSLVPPAGVADMVAETCVSAMVEENFYEVLNIGSSLFNLAGSDHVRLATMHPAGDVPAPAAELLTGSSWVLAVTPRGYATGHLVFHHA